MGDKYKNIKSIKDNFIMEEEKVQDIDIHHNNNRKENLIIIQFKELLIIKMEIDMQVNY